MNIALIGVPGSGKSSLAYRLRTHIEANDPCECDPATREVAIVDNYVEAIERETNYASGPITDYLGNLFIALGRYARERKARQTQRHVITCGTLIETAVYTAMQFVSLAEVLDEEGQLAEAPRVEAMLRMLSVLYKDVMQYDLAFYLAPQVEVEEDSQHVDKQLQLALQGFKLLPVVALTDPAAQLDQAIEAVDQVLKGASEAPVA